MMDDTPELTQLVRAPSGVISARAWRAFHFSALPSVRRRHVALLKTLEWLIPNVTAVADVSSALERRMGELLDERVSIGVESVSVVPLSKLSAFFGKTTFLAVLAPLPHKSRGLMEVDLRLAHQIIDLLLGGAGEAMALRPLTDIEEGVMTYVLIETLRVLSPAIDASIPRLRLEGVVRGLEEIQGLIPEDEDLAVVQFHVRVGSQNGSIRVMVPESVVALASPGPTSEVRARRLAADALAHRHRLRSAAVSLRVEVGSVEITSQDLAGIRERDVLLVDELTCRSDLGENGQGWFRVGAGDHASISVDIAMVGEQYQATITGFGPGLSSRHGSDDVDEGQGDGGAEVLRDIPLHIAVELGRVNTTADEVVSLKVGQVFDLQRTAGEPVDLSVNGKRIARGELVEVDGNLGVRILSLVT